jgi:hypothetical protein
LRVNIVFGLLLVLFVATGVMMGTRERIAHTPPAPPPPSSAAASAAALGSAAAPGSAAASGSAASPVDAGPATLMDRPLRAVTLGWDLSAPGVLANGGLDPVDTSDFSKAGVVTYLRPLEAMSAIEGALARGGGDKDGADIAVIPLSELVASYERLRALTPEVFFVVGWSHGREALVTSLDALPTLFGKPERAPGDKGDKQAGFPMMGTAGEPATFLGLFALDENGMPPSFVHLVTRGDKPALAAIDRDAPTEPGWQNIFLTTADASRLVPFVAVAQHGLVDAHPRALAAWARVWVEAARKLDADPPAAARTIAAAPGAPEPIALLKRLGEIAPAPLGDNARAFGLSGRDALTLEVLFQQTWRIWRAAGILATPAPDASPINSSIVASLVRSHPALAAAPGPAKPKPVEASPDALKTLVTYRQPEGKVDPAALLATAGLLANVFERSVLRVVVTKAGGVDAAATKHFIEDVEQRFDLAPGRVVAAKKAPAKAGAAVEVLVAP